MGLFCVDIGLFYIDIGLFCIDMHTYRSLLYVYRLILCRYRSLFKSLLYRYLLSTKHISFVGLFCPLCCSVLQRVALCTTQHHTATPCNTLQHTATHCNTLQHTDLSSLNHSAFFCTNSRNGARAMVSSSPPPNPPLPLPSTYICIYFVYATSCGARTIDWFWLRSWLIHNRAICTRIDLLWRDTRELWKPMLLHELTFSTKNWISKSVYCTPPPPLPFLLPPPLTSTYMCTQNLLY